MVFKLKFNADKVFWFAVLVSIAGAKILAHLQYCLNKQKQANNGSLGNFSNLVETNNFKVIKLVQAFLVGEVLVFMAKWNFKRLNNYHY